MEKKSVLKNYGFLGVMLLSMLLGCVLGWLLPEAAAAIQNGDSVSVDFDSGKIHDETTGQDFQAVAFPAFINRIIEHDGLLPYLKARQDAEEGK